jgi:osmotically inducible protein OsmC
MRVDNSGPKITGIHLVTEAQVPGIDAAGFQKAATEAKEKCPISTLLKPGLENLTLDAKLKS